MGIQVGDMAMRKVEEGEGGRPTRDFLQRGEASTDRVCLTGLPSNVREAILTYYIAIKRR